jgi:FkbM family methyltransferase
MSLVERLVASRAWDRVHESLPVRVSYAVDAAGLAADLPSLRKLLAYRAWDPAAGPMPVRIRQLGGIPMLLRPRSSDVWALMELLPPACHLPPPEVDASEIRTVWDLGANAGYTIAHMALQLPGATIVGVELDDGNARLARANTAQWEDRCSVVHAAVWSEDGEISYRQRPGDEIGLRVAGGGDADGADVVHAPALSLDTLLATHPPEGGRIDYLKMDIEGAEAEVLARNTDWVGAVGAMTVEVHEPYRVEACARTLSALGFRVRVDTRYLHRSDGRPPVVAIRE